MLIEDVKKLPALERLLYWINERESIRLKKEAGLPKPWTNDRVLQTYFFCNVNRQDDKVTRWLTTNWYRPYKNHPAIVAACSLARFVNNPLSLVGVTPHLFAAAGIQWAEVEAALRERLRVGPVFSPAYMINGVVGEDKITSILRRVRGLVDGGFEPVTSSMERTHTALLGFEGYGSFMAGQVVADLRWAMTGTWGDKWTWAPEGPGSRQGLDRLLTENFTREAKWASFQEELTKLMAVFKEQLPTAITSRLEAQSAQSCLCEFSKYEKGLWGDARVKRRYNGGTSPPPGLLDEVN